MPIEDGRRFGIVAVDEADRVTGFQEKPQNPPAMPGQPDLALASMGIYVFDSDVLIKALEEDAAKPDSHHDFGKNIIPSLIGHGRDLRLSVLRREQEGGEVLARHRHARRVLRGAAWTCAR